MGDKWVKKIVMHLMTRFKLGMPFFFIFLGGEKGVVPHPIFNRTLAIVTLFLVCS
jgi:hypothetical protein